MTTDQHMDRKPATGTDRPGFTLIEILIVVGIIALLIGLAVPATTALLQRNRRTSTLATMKVVENAIQRYVSERPQAGLTRACTSGAKEPCYEAHYGKLPPDYFVWVPAPGDCETFVDSTSGALDNDRWDEGEAIKDDYIDQEQESTNRFNAGCLVADFPRVSVTPGAGKGGLQHRDAPFNVVPERDYRSIESLVFYISQLSPQGKSILAGIQSSFIGNKDVCAGKSCPDYVILGVDKSGAAVASTIANTVDLIEILDAWGNPLRYRVREVSPKKFQWELRSAGPDGVFADPFSSADTSDDVTLEGE